MKQASDSLLTLCPILLKAMPGVPASPRDKAWANGRLRTPFRVYRENAALRRSIFPGKSCPPRSSVCSKLGEGRIRSLLTGAHLILTFVCLTLLVVKSALGAGGIVINLKEEACVQSSYIVLRDVAKLQGLDAVWIDGLAETPLGPAPEFGAVKIISRHQISEIVRNAAGPVRDISFVGAPAVQVKLQGRQLESKDLAPVLRAYLLETTHWRDQEIAILSVGNLKGIEVPPGELNLLVSSKASVSGRNRIMVPIDVVQTGKTLRSFWVTADVSVRAEILTALKKIPAGKTVDADDVVKAPVEIRDLDANYIRSLEDVLGKVARRNFSPGDPLTREAFTNPFLVKSGETFHLRLERNGIVLTSLARAEQDGRLGQVIRVRNLDFSTSLKAQVTGRAEVRIQ